MNILNKEELRRQIREGKEVSLDGILDEFKGLLKEALQTATEEELTSHLGYDKNQESQNLIKYLYGKRDKTKIRFYKTI